MHISRVCPPRRSARRNRSLNAIVPGMSASDTVTVIRANGTILHYDAAGHLVVLASATLPLTISRFTTAFPDGPACGATERTTWGGVRCPASAAAPRSQGWSQLCSGDVQAGTGRQCPAAEGEPPDADRHRAGL